MWPAIHTGHTWPFDAPVLWPLWYPGRDPGRTYGTWVNNYLGINILSLEWYNECI